MNKQWPKVRLGELLVRSTADVQVDPVKSYPFAGVYCFGRGVFRGQERLGNQFSYRKLTRLKVGDFVYPKLMAWEGAFGVVPITCDGCFVSPEFPVFEIHPDRILPQFLSFFFQIPHVWEDVSGKSTGTNVRRRRLHPNDLLRANIPLPPLPEQQRIVARIEALAAQIDEARRLRQQALLESESLLISMAHRSDLDPVSKERTGWKRKRLSEVIRLVDDSYKVKPDQSYPNLGIYSFGRGLFHKPPINGLATSAISLRRVRAGQFIYSRLFAFEGAYGQVSPEFNGVFVSNEYPTFDCDPSFVRAEFLAAYFRPAQVWKAVATGSKGLGDRRQRVQPDQVLAHELWVPPISEQEQLVTVQPKSGS